MNVEQRRLSESNDATKHWRLWGPYLSERQWGTVREDYSADGDAWAHFPFEQASGRTYRWGEDGIAGMSDDEQRICLALALWNGRDPILKERLFGGNSNWRGPIWFPINYLILRALQRFHDYYTDDFRVECPIGSGRQLTISEVADELSERLVSLFLRDQDGRRAVFGENVKLQEDEHFRDYLQFYEFFHGDTGRGLGASHQTGWTGLVAWMLMPRKPGG